MTPKPPKRMVRAAGCVAAVLLAVFTAPLVALAHAELETASPPDGAVLDSPPTEIVLTFTEALDPVKSHMELIGPDGTQAAAGVVDSANDKSMRIDPPELAPGAYEIRSTAFAAHDGALKRESLTFTIAAPSPTPTAAPSASATPSQSPSAPPSPSPSPAPSAGGPTSASGADVLVPILAALIVVVLLGAMLLRGRSRGGGRG